METVKVTQIMPYYNAENYLKESIESILNQTYQNIELICIDDASTDNSRSIVESFNDVRIIHITNDENHGCAYCRNQGLLAATGEYIGFMDADDISVKNKLSKEVAYLNENKDVLVVSGSIAHIDKKGRYLEKIPTIYREDSDIRAFMLYGNCIANGCAMFRREVIDKYHIMKNDKLRTSSDFLFWHKCINHGKIHCLDEVLYLYRFNHESAIQKQVKKSPKTDDKILISILNYAWKTRGFRLSKNEIKYIFDYFYRGKNMETPSDYLRGYKLYWKIKIQSDKLYLAERDKILELYRGYMKKHMVSGLKNVYKVFNI